MLKDNIYIGNINIVENGVIRLYQNTSPLLSLGNGSYVNLEWVVSLKDYLEFYKGTLTGNYGKKLTISSKIPENGIYIDEDSLIPYYDENDKKMVSINKVNQDIMIDPRIPRGIDYCQPDGTMLPDGTILKYIRRKNPQK